MPKFAPKKLFSLYEDDSHFGNQPKMSRFIRDLIKAHIEMGGVNCEIYRMKGTFPQTKDPLGIKVDPSGTATTPGTDVGRIMTVQDPVLNENRDREYNLDEIPILKGAYQVSANELEYARFGMALANDVITMEFHAQEMERLCGRRLIPGDVIRLNHLREVGLDGRVRPKWYELARITWSPGGYDQMYQHHVLGCILKPMRNRQEFQDILDREDEYGKTVADQARNAGALGAISDAISDLASRQVNQTGINPSLIWIDPKDPTQRPLKWYDDAIPPDALPINQGTRFPSNPTDLDYFVRTDMNPNRLYQWFGGRWRLREKDQQRVWQPYNWMPKLREFMSDRSPEDKARKWSLVRIHDVLTEREDRSDPSPRE